MTYVIIIACTIIAVAAVGSFWIMDYALSEADRREGDLEDWNRW